MNSKEELKFRILICLYKTQDTGNSVTGISKTLQKEKYEISRSMIQMEKEGLVDRSDNRAPKLTEKGKERAEYYQARIDVVLNHLLYVGVDLEHAKQDSYILALRCSDAMIEVMKKNDERYRVRRKLRGRKKFDGATLCKEMRDGTYEFPFIVYRDKLKENSIISMANRAFEHPCTLCVHNGRGTIQIRILYLLEKSRLNGMPVTGQVVKFDYFDHGYYTSAEMYGDIISFPAAALNFMNMGEGAGQILHGGVGVRLQSSVGSMHMFESEAYFTLLI